MAISEERLKAESGVSLQIARMQNASPPPAGTISKGLAHTGDLAMVHEALPPADPYAMSTQERAKYERLFPLYDADGDGFVTGAEAVDLFSKSRLPREVSFCISTERVGNRFSMDAAVDH